ncbi:hypothetical protein [Aporhodopirellula aestuarii]|uniref:Uncharacterized protein n=1 Tax=Aporhodopirellula aestuarii TaxID=2950107 RepID=A0ABT0U6T0_9BACT|nr:hypothetical protein [Aporhodopirellula aestuarii]MCM2372113.1 hypothetical protein [Aporhodopirellula aestuarii]
MADDLNEEIHENAARSVEQQRLTDWIAADKHLAGKSAVRKPNRGWRFK